MSEERCTTCGEADRNDLHRARCAYDKAAASTLWEYASRLDRAPKRSEVSDLFAHLRVTYDDGGLARRTVTQLLDLGWRPAFGDGAK